MKKSFSNYELIIVLALILILLAIAAPKLIQSRKSNNEAKAIGCMRAISSAQAIYVERSPTRTFGTLAQLGQAHLIQEQLATGTTNGYRFEAIPNPKLPEYAFDCLASPINEFAGNRYFFVDQSGVIRFSTEAYSSIAQARASTTLGAPGGK